MIIRPGQNQLIFNVNVPVYTQGEIKTKLRMNRRETSDTDHKLKTLTEHKGGYHHWLPIYVCFSKFIILVVL